MLKLVITVIPNRREKFKTLAPSQRKQARMKMCEQRRNEFVQMQFSEWASKCYWRRDSDCHQKQNKKYQNIVKWVPLAARRQPAKRTERRKIIIKFECVFLSKVRSAFDMCRFCRMMWSSPSSSMLNDEPIY